jgi:peptidyl-prolyl cis-trans isomerase A (cyclophilin A)
MLIMSSLSCWNSLSPEIEIKTELGSIVVEIYPKKAPITCNNFIKYIKNQKFQGINFYRVVRMDNQPKNNIKIEVIQGGLGFDNLDSSFDPIRHETTEETGLLHEDGTISMARNEPGTASSEFFICIGNQPQLDYGGQRNPDGQGFAAFGKVVKGFEIVKKIQQMNDVDQMLINEVKIHSITIL